MQHELHPGRVGYQGKDSMRDKAKRMFGSSMTMDMNMPRSRSEKSKEKPRLYARGGEVANYHDPEAAPKMKRGGHHPHRPKTHEHHKAHKGPRTPGLNIESARAAEHMKRGGHSKHHAKKHKHHYDMGGGVEMMGANPATYSPVAAKRGGKIKKKCFNDGGMVGHEMHDGEMALKRGGKAHHGHHKKKHHGHEQHYDFGGRVRQALNFARENAPRAMNFARQNAPRALEMAKQYAPQAREAISRYAPRVGQGLERAYDFAKQNAPRAQEFIGKFSPGMAERFGQLRSAVGLKKGGKAHAHHKGHHRKHHGHMLEHHKKHHDEHYAMGGVGKIRHGQSTKSGMPTHRRVVKGR